MGRGHDRTQAIRPSVPITAADWSQNLTTFPLFCRTAGYGDLNVPEEEAVSQILNSAALQAATTLDLTASSLATTELLVAQTNETRTADTTSDTAEAIPVALPPPVRSQSTSPLVPPLIAGLTALAPATALAQTPGMDQLAAATSHLPGPAWQLVVGGLLYAEPALRATSRIIRKIVSFFTKPADRPPPPAKPQSIVQTVNQITGAIERKIAPLRDTAAIGIGLYAGGRIVFGGDGLTDHIPAAIAAGLALWNYNDRTARVESAIIRHQIDTGERLTPAGWRAQDARAMGVFAPDVPQHFPAEHLAGKELPTCARGANPGFSLARNLKALWTTVGMLTGVMRRSHVYIEGNRKTFMSWLTSIRPGKHAPVSEKYLEAVDVMLPQWAMRICEHYGVTLKFNDLEKLKSIPQGAPVVFASFPHSAIYTDFLFWAALSRARFVADKRNFHDHWFIRAIGLAWFLDVIGLPFVSRDKTKPNNGAPVSSRTSLAPQPSSVPPPHANGNGNGSQAVQDLYEQTTDRMSRYGIQPVYFGQAGRAPRAYRDDRTLGRPGLYSNVVNPKKPERYYNLNGTINTAIAAARQSGQDAYIPILHIDGSGRVMPKIAKNPPFIQPVQPGDITFSIVDTIRVSATSEIADIERQIIAAAKKATGINEFLQREFNRWANEAENPELTVTFAAQADAQEILYIIADRIRSVHPNRAERNQFKARLMDIVERTAAGEVIGDALRILLADVSSVVKETEYQ